MAVNLCLQKQLCLSTTGSVSCGSTQIFRWFVIFCFSSQVVNFHVFLSDAKQVKGSSYHQRWKIQWKQICIETFIVIACDSLQSLLNCSHFLNFTVVKPFLSFPFGNSSTWEGERSIFHSSLVYNSYWEEQNATTAVKGFGK